jgi:KAP family P-loop domain
LDHPISGADDDDFDRTPFVRRLVDGLIDRDSSKSTEVTIGLYGPWGSGKTSVLNLVTEDIRRRHKAAVVVRFDPWLVAGRESLIAEFFAELVRALTRPSVMSPRVKKLSKELLGYAQYLAPAAAIADPSAGIAASVFTKIWEAKSKKAKPLETVRQDLIKRLRDEPVPIIVLIDELDRIDDESVRTMCQVVRAIGNLPSISYLLAYDRERVAAALSRLGSQHSSGDGEAYLEKIVNVEIPVPALTKDELLLEITRPLTDNRDRYGVPSDLSKVEDYEVFVKTIIPGLVVTPRDAAKIASLFDFYASALRDEVDWVDLLAFCVLKIKSREVSRKLENEPWKFIGEWVDHAGPEYFAWGERKPQERLVELLGTQDPSPPVKSLVEFMFPYLSEHRFGKRRGPNAICNSRPLNSVLRFGILPGGVSRQDLLSFLACDHEGMKEELLRHHSAGTLSNLLGRIEETYGELNREALLRFWRAADSILEHYSENWCGPDHLAARLGNTFSSILERALMVDGGLKGHAREVYFAPRDEGRDMLSSKLLRNHFFYYGLYGHEDRGAGNSYGAAFLNKDEVGSLAIEMAKLTRQRHLEGKLFPRRSDLTTVYLTKDVGLWDAKCREAFTELLKDRDAAVGIFFAFYGGNYYAEAKSVDALIDKAALDRLAQDWLTNQNLDEVLKRALLKCLQNSP